MMGFTMNRIASLLHIISLSWMSLTLALLTGCGERNGAAFVEPTLPISEPNHFAQYQNRQASLPAGSYKIIATTLAPGASGSYSLDIEYDDKTTETIASSWASSIGQNPDPAAHNAGNVHGFSLIHAGGINISLESPGNDAFLYLLDRNNNVLYSSTTTYPGVSQAGAGVTRVSIDLPQSIVDSVAYSNAYYNAIDPNGERTTLYKWRLANCFNNDPASNFGADVHVVFRDVKDLGYGRSMYWKFGCDGNGNEDAQPGAAAVFVENFDVEVIPGFPYSTLNLDAVIANDRNFHFGTNAIEFNDWTGAGPVGRKFNKFYTFKPVSTANDADETRVNQVDLDGRGKKAAPTNCIFCHGGDSRPLDPDGSFPLQPLTTIRGDTNAKLQILDVDELEFRDSGAYSRAEQEALLKTVNQVIYCSYPNVAPPDFCTSGNLESGNFGATFPTSPPTTGEWTGNLTREVVEGWYGGPEFPNATFDGSFVPPGWDPNDIANAGKPPDIDQLYLEVIKPSCLLCHARKGTDLGTAGTLGKDIDFSTYDKFISFSDTLEEYVYDRGFMPLSLLGFDLFWASNQPTILGTYIEGFSHMNADGRAIRPGRPFADAGPDRTLNIPAIISGEGSEFGNSYEWSIIGSPDGSSPTLTNTAGARVTFNTDMDGVYTLQLTVSNGTDSDTDTADITVDSTKPVPASLTYTADILPMVGTGGSLGCDLCHNDTDAMAPGVQGTQPGIPVVWNGSDGSDPWRTLLSRIDLNDPAESLVLRKATGHHHFGGTLIDRATPAGDAAYNTILSWIIEGAVKN